MNALTGWRKGSVHFNLLYPFSFLSFFATVMSMLSVCELAKLLNKVRLVSPFKYNSWILKHEERRYVYSAFLEKQSHADSCQRDWHLYSGLLFTVHTSCPLTQLIRSCSVSTSITSLCCSYPRQPWWFNSTFEPVFPSFYYCLLVEDNTKQPGL